MVLRMLEGMIKEHGGRVMRFKGPSMPIPAACKLDGALKRSTASTSTSSNWLSTSAVMHKQVPGHALLHHLAALHGIAACSHSSRRHTHCCSSSGSGPYPRLHTNTHAGLTLQQLQPQPQPLSSSLGFCSQTGLLQQQAHAQVCHQRACTVGLRSSSSSSHPRVAAVRGDAPAGGPLQPAVRHAAVPAQPAAQQHQHHLHHRHVVATQQLLPQRAGGWHACSAAGHTGRGPLLKYDRHAAHSRPAATAAIGTRGPQGYAAGSSIDASSWLQKRPMDMTPEEKHQLLLEKLADAWGEVPGDLQEGTQRLTCPACQNGSHGDDCFAVTVTEDSILWCCHRANCGFQGGVYTFGGRDGSSSSAEAAAGAAAEALKIQGSAGGALSPMGGDPSMAQWQQQQQQKLLNTKKAPPVGFGADLEDLNDATEDGREFLNWFRARGISAATLQRNGVKMAVRHCEAKGGKVPHIAFPYRRNGVIVNVKYRALEKHFIQEKGGEQIFYGYDDAKGADEVIIVEGEMDKLALDEALAHRAAQTSNGNGTSVTDSSDSSNRRIAVLSVPSGAPSEKAAGASRNLERKFSFLHACSDILHSVQRVILAVDNDGPGIVLADELARRIGREKCWRVTWPTGQHDSRARQAADTAAALAAASAHDGAAGAADLAMHSDGAAAAAAVPAADSSGGGDAAAAAADYWARKDANEVLMKDGPKVLLEYINAAQPLPIRGLFRFEEFWPQAYDLYQQGPRGLSWGVSSGWDSVDEYYKVVPGELTIVTGLANSGKSEWLDALAVNLARQHNWRIALCSMENSAREHGRKLMEKYTGKAFLNAAYSVNTAKMNFLDVVDALVWIDTHFHIIRPPVDQLPSIDYILDKARAAVLRYGIQGLVIDPYNELDHRRPSTFSETEHVSRLLTKIKRFAQHYDCHVWFVAHPRTQRGLGVGGGTATLSAPTMYDISGSANFINKADNGIVVHRPYTGGQGDPYAVQLLVRKVRNKLAGKIGDVMLRYDRATGCYVECDAAA